MTTDRTALSRRGFGALAAGAGASLALAASAQARPGRDDAKAVEEILAGMSIEQKIGQMFVAVGYGSRVDQAHKSNTETTGVATIAEIIRTHHVGGLIYFSWSDNLEDCQQVASLSDGAQKVALDADGIPLLISTDEERGVVSRLPAPATELPGSMGLGATGSRWHARACAKLTAKELRVCGIAQAFAPIVDVNVDARNPVIGVRSFGADPETVSRLAVAQVKAFQREGVASTVKHFPGHGDTAVDSHVGLPEIDHSREELERLDLPPFRAAIDAGVDSIMTAHILVPALDDSGRPATLSRPILTGLLREELGYDGVIVTDSLAMEGVRTLFKDDRVPVEAILAGADQMLMPPNLTTAINGVRKAVKAGEITEERLDASVRRILTLKAKRGLLEDPYSRPDRIEAVVGSRHHRWMARTAADDAVTLISKEGDALPLRRGRRVLVTGAGGDSSEILAGYLRNLRIQAEHFPIKKVTAESAKQAAARAADYDAVITLTSSGAFETPAEQVALVKAVVATGVPTVHVSLRNPYDVVHVGPVDASIAAYAYTDCSLRAVARLAAGRMLASGKLPVAIPTADGKGEAFPIGRGLCR